jgi:hypothetical protein
MAKVLWKQINLTDFNGMTGAAAVSGTGGGARHIVLGTSKPDNDVAGFLPAGHGNQATVQTAAGPAWPKSNLTFRSNPKRRNGEWLIVDQKNNRHPAWTTAAGFPASFDSSNPPVVLVVEKNGTYHVAWLDRSTLTSLAPAIVAAERGVSSIPSSLLNKFNLFQKSALEEFSTTAAALPAQAFDPANKEDARQRVFAEIVRRQGQAAFRKKLVKVYDGACAISGCIVLWVLEAAHISPYRGPDTNKRDNGLLLRADIHTLFDLGLISVNPDTLAIRVAAQITEKEYRAFHGKALSIGTVAPSKAALQEHWARSTG